MRDKYKQIRASILESFKWAQKQTIDAEYMEKLVLTFLNRLVDIRLDANDIKVTASAINTKESMANGHLYLDIEIPYYMYQLK